MKKALKIIILFVIVSSTLFAFFHWEVNKRKKTNTISNKGFTPNLATSSQISVNNNTSNGQSPAIDTTTNSATTATQDQPASQDTPSNLNLPAKYILNMPFYSQTPLGNWDAVHENTCEEASVLNGGLYLLGKKLSPTEFDQEMINMIDIEKKLSINFTDSTVTETKQYSDAYFAGKLQIKIIDNPTTSDIETEVAAGNPVVVPLAGREIGNPNFTPPGPLYHMLVVKGYDAQNFITNDVGTRKGDSYTYKKELIMQKMHDWNSKDIHLGAKRILVLSKNN